MIQTLLKSQFKRSCEIEMLQKKGPRRFVKIEGSLLQNKLIQLNITDMTPMQHLLTQVLELENSLTLVNNTLHHVSDAVIAIDNELYVRVMNQSFYDVFYKLFSIKIQVGTNLSIALADFPDLKAKIVSASKEAMLGKKISIMLENDNNNNELYYCHEILIQSTHNQSANMNILILCIKSLTEFKLEERRKHKQHADIALASRTATMGEVASAFAHEINQPLTAIGAYSQGCLFMLKNVDNNKQVVQEKLLFPLEQIIFQAEHAGKIIHNMKNFMHGKNSNIEKTDINTLIKETLSILNYELHDIQLKITLDLSDDLPDILVNKTHIMQVILNLARNSAEALQSTKENRPEIQIKTREEDSHIVVHVIDNGPGIPVEFQDKILNTHFTTKRQGAGIGLGVCRSLIESLGGNLSLHQHHGKGAWFIFTLPIIS